MKHKKPPHGGKRHKLSHPLKPHHNSKISKKSQSGPGAKKQSQPNLNPNARPIIPFSPTSSLLLIGEGDFSFTSSLISASYISPATIITTTTNDSEAVTYQKYPHAEATVSSLKEGGHRVLFSIDATKKFPKSISKRSYDVIIFNFPHVGGLSTHVDRQVRANQELLLSFFKTCLPVLSPDYEDEVFTESIGGKVVVTLFTGKPYDDWNIKELAKSCGLETIRSFKFDGGMYEGYKHVRTIGVREREGDWKGEERGARTYIFGLPQRKKRRPKKVEKKDSDDEDEDD